MKNLTTGLAVGVGAAVGMAAINTFRRAFSAVKREFVDQLAQVDEIAKYSDRLGITTQNLAGLQLQAGLAGVSTRELNTSLRTMLKNVGEAAAGIGEASQTLRDLGIDAKSFQRLETGEQFKVLADRISQIPSAAGRAAAAYRVFGRSGVQLMSALQHGAEGVEQARRRAAQLGIAVSREEAARVEAANDAMLEFRQSIAGVARTFMVRMAPAITAAGKALTNFMVRGDGTRSTFARLADTAISGFTNVARVLQIANRTLIALRIAALRAAVALTYVDLGLSETLSTLRDELRTEADALEKTMQEPLAGTGPAERLNQFTRTLQETGNAWREAGRMAQEGSAAMQAAAANAPTPAAAAAAQTAGDARPGSDTADIIARVYEKTKELLEAGEMRKVQELREQIIRWEDPLKRNLQVLEGLTQATRDFREAQKQAFGERMRDAAKQVYEQTRTPMEQLWAEYDRLKELFDGGFITKETANRALRQARERLLGGQDARAETGALSRVVMNRGVEGNRNAQEREQKDQGKTLKAIEKNTREAPVARAG